MQIISQSLRIWIWQEGKSALLREDSQWIRRLRKEKLLWMGRKIQQNHGELFLLVCSKEMLIRFQITGEDVTAGVASVKYYCSKRPLSEEDVKNLPSKEWVKGDAFAVNPDQQCIVYGKVEDLAGNICFLYPISGMITECSEPKSKMTLEGEKSGGVYRGDVTVKIEAEDLQAGDTYSGIQQVFYHVAAEENVQADKEEILFQKEDHQTRGKARWEGAVVIPAEVFNSK